MAAAEADNGDTVIEMDLLPPRWVDIADEVTEILADIARSSAKLDKLHSKHVLPGFDDEDTKRAEEGEIERLTQEITRGFHSCQKAIQRVEMMVREARQAPGGVSRGEEAIARNIQVNLATRVQDASAGFRKKQSAYLKSAFLLAFFAKMEMLILMTELRGLGGMASPIPRSSTPLNPYTDPSLLDADSDAHFSSSTLQQSSQRMQQKHLTSNDHAIMQREREISEIAKGIIELADIFKELQTMVIDQGTMLDRVDYNVERMATDVRAADKELTVASGYQKKTTKRKAILLLLILVAGMIILLIVKPKKGGGPPNTGPSTKLPGKVGVPVDGEGNIVGGGTAVENNAWDAVDGAPSVFENNAAPGKRGWTKARRRRRWDELHISM